MTLCSTEDKSWCRWTKRKTPLCRGSMHFQDGSIFRVNAGTVGHACVGEALGPQRTWQRNTSLPRIENREHDKNAQRPVNTMLHAEIKLPGAANCKAAENPGSRLLPHTSSRLSPDQWFKPVSPSLSRLLRVVYRDSVLPTLVASGTPNAFPLTTSPQPVSDCPVTVEHFSRASTPLDGADSRHHCLPDSLIGIPNRKIKSVAECQNFPADRLLFLWDSESFETVDGLKYLNIENLEICAKCEVKSLYVRKIQLIGIYSFTTLTPSESPSSHPPAPTRALQE
ncbi:hypothetical protein CBL_11084 [Carabus blaptoides fortunei]